jgi:hypothetical protein
MKNTKLSVSLKGNQNAKGSHHAIGGGKALAQAHKATPVKITGPFSTGGAKVGTIGALFGPVGSLAAGAIAGNKANTSFGTANQAGGEKVIARARKASAVVGGVAGALGTVASGTAAHSALLGAVYGGTRGAIFGGAAGIAAGAALGAAVNYGASRLGARAIGSGKSKYKK